jgi:hypothetical protein
MAQDVKTTNRIEFTSMRKQFFREEPLFRLTTTGEPGALLPEESKAGRLTYYGQ